MYYNSKGEKVSRAKWREMYSAFKNRQELIAAGLMNRRDLFRMGLLSGAGFLVAKSGLSAWADYRSGGSNGQCASPPTTPWTLPMPIMPTKQQTSISALSPAPTINPNTAVNPSTGMAYEGRTRAHQAPAMGFAFPAPAVYQLVQRQAQVNMSNQLPLQTIWGFDGMSPGPTFVSMYGVPALVRNANNLPSNNGGFGINSASTHLHGGHTPSESDGFPCDYFAAGQYYDQYYPNALPGFSSGYQPYGDINEAQSTLWYHDHRASFTAQNNYKGLSGFHLLFNQNDSGDETSGFRLPSFPAYDIPMMFTDRCFDPTTGLLAFDSFNLDGILGDKFLVNGVIQPVLHVHPRRYRLRWLNSGPARFYQIYLTDLNNPSASNPFWQISNDSNLLRNPVQVPAVAMGVAERADVIIDFSQYAGKTIYLENRLSQSSGRGPDGNVVSAGQGNLLLQIVVDLPAVADNSVDPATGPSYYQLPSTSAPNVVSRSCKFDQDYNGQWTINGRYFDCNNPRFLVTLNGAERWSLEGSRGWSHPVHIHAEQFQVTSGAPGLYGNSSNDSRNYSRWGSQYCYQNCSSGGTGVNASRKDVVRLVDNGNATIFIRFRDWLGRYALHCHNILHEDHAMMLRFDVATVGDANSRP